MNHSHHIRQLLRKYAYGITSANHVPPAMTRTCLTKVRADTASVFSWFSSTNSPLFSRLAVDYHAGHYPARLCYHDRQIVLHLTSFPRQLHLIFSDVLYFFFHHRSCTNSSENPRSSKKSISAIKLSVLLRCIVDYTRSIIFELERYI